MKELFFVHVNISEREADIFAETVGSSGGNECTAGFNLCSSNEKP